MGIASWLQMPLMSGNIWRYQELELFWQIKLIKIFVPNYQLGFFLMDQDVKSPGLYKDTAVIIWWTGDICASTWGMSVFGGVRNMGLILQQNRKCSLFCVSKTRILFFLSTCAHHTHILVHVLNNTYQFTPDGPYCNKGDLPWSTLTTVNHLDQEMGCASSYYLQVSPSCLSVSLWYVHVICKQIHVCADSPPSHLMAHWTSHENKVVTLKDFGSNPLVYPSCLPAPLLS